MLILFLAIEDVEHLSLEAGTGRAFRTYDGGVDSHNIGRVDIAVAINVGSLLGYSGTIDYKGVNGHHVSSVNLAVAVNIANQSRLGQS